MVTFDDVERFVLTLPETTSSPSYGGSPALRVNRKFLARLRTEMADDHDELTGGPFGEVLVLQLADLGEKEALLGSDPRTFFTTRHYDGYPAVLVRLTLADEQELRELLMETWLALAPKRAVRAYTEQGGKLPPG